MPPLEVLTEKSPNMHNIVVFVSLCRVYRDPSKNSFACRAQVGSIDGCSDETKGFKVFLKQENKVITTQHVKNIKTLSEAQNSQLQSAFGDGHKDDANGDLERHKARLVACGNEQVFGVDYALTFAAVMDMTTVKVILALAATWGVPAKHGDVPNAYVKAKKEQHLEILMHIPKGMTIDASDLKKLGATSSKDVVLELKKSLYGLKQVGGL